MPNPYDFTRPVLDPRMFYGREAEIKDILPGLQAGKSYAIIGGGLSGKTSLLLALKRALMQDLEGNSACVVGPVFLSADEMPRITPTAIYRKIVERFREEVCALKRPGWQVDVTRMFQPGVTDDNSFDIFKDILAAFVDRVGPSLRVVILLDQVDRLQQEPCSRVLFWNLRSLICNSPVSNNVAITISGTVALYALYKMGTSPFLGVVKATHTLRPLAEADTIELIQRPCGYIVRPAAVEEILKQTGGHPFLVQFLMEHLWARFHPNMALAQRADVLSAVDLFFETRRDFSYWVGGFTDANKRVYCLIAEAEAAVRRVDLIKEVADSDAVNESLDLLVHLGVVRQPARNSFAVGPEMFRTWFREHVASRDSRPSPSASKPPRATGEHRRVIRVVLASPSDVEKERRCTEAAVQRLNHGVAKKQNCMLELSRWEVDTRPQLDERGPQGPCDDALQIESCDVLVAIFWMRFGKGTMHELSKALQSRKERRKPEVMIYFCEREKRPANREETLDYAELLTFRDELQDKGLLGTFTTESEFEMQVQEHLTQYLLRGM